MTRCVHILNIYCICCRFKRKTENGSPCDFLYPLLIVQTEDCRLSVNRRRNERNLSACRRTKRTKWTFPSVAQNSDFLLVKNAPTGASVITNYKYNRDLPAQSTVLTLTFLFELSRPLHAHTLLRHKTYIVHVFDIH